MTAADAIQLLFVALAAVLAPIVVEPLRRFAIPAVVLEIGFGYVLGPQALDLVRPSGIVDGLSTLGLSMLMFLAGYELRLQNMVGRPLKLAGISWAMSAVLAGVIGLTVHLVGGHSGEIVIPLALTTTAIGTLLPVLRDAGVLHTDFGRYALALGSVGEFGPIVLVALLLSGDNPVQSIAVLAGFGVLIVASALLASRPWGSRVVGIVEKGLTASSQLPIRMTLLFMLALAAVANTLGVDVLLGAFAAGVIVRIAAGSHEDTEETESTSRFATKLEGIGFGLLVPVFFVVSGTRIDLRSLVDDPTSWLFVPGFLLLMLLVRAIPTFICFRGIFRAGRRRALAIMMATGLPLIVVITTIATENGYITTADAAAMVAAGMLSVLLFPALSLRLLGRDTSDAPVRVEPGAGL